MAFSRSHAGPSPAVAKQGRFRATAAWLLVPLLSACGGPGPNPPPPGRGDVLRTSYLASPFSESASGVAAHVDGGVVVAATTGGALAGPRLGFDDAVLARIAADGTVVWAQQFGGGGRDSSEAVASDAAGNAIVVGSTASDLAGDSQDHYDAFVRKYDPDGNLLWSRRFGSSSDDRASAVATDADGAVFVAGWTQGTLAEPNAGLPDAYLRMYDASGEVVWTRQFGTPLDDVVYAAATSDDGLIAVAGATRGDLDGVNAGPEGTLDAFLRLYSPSAGGQVLWARQFGTAQEEVLSAVRVDGRRDVIVAGYTQGSLVGLNAGGWDAFVRKYSVSGTLLWTRQFGTTADDVAYGLSIDADDNIAVVGYTSGDLAGKVGATDAFLRVYGPDGDELWTRQFGAGPTATTESAGVAITSAGEIVVVGRTDRRFDDTLALGFDVFIRAYAP